MIRRLARSFCGMLVVAWCAGCRSGAVAQHGFVAGPNSPIAVGAAPSALAVADFNGDGRPDLALTCGAPAEAGKGDILLLINDGDARFKPGKAGRIDVGQPVDALAVADFNGDRHVDVVATGHDFYHVHIFLGDGQGGLRRAPGSPFLAHAGSRPHTHAVAAADVNGDGHADVLTTNADDNAIAVLLNDGQARFSPAPGSPFAALRHPYSSLAVRDLDGDGRADVAVPLLETGAIGVYLGDGAGRFSAAPDSPYRVAARPGFVHADDVNGDGKPDLLATHDDVGMVDVLLNTGGGRFQLAPGSPVRLREAVWGAATADLDGDGDRDAVLTATGRSLALLRGDGRGGFTPARPGLAVGASPNRVECADLDGDGRMDIVCSNHESGDVTVLLRR